MKMCYGVLLLVVLSFAAQADTVEWHVDEDGTLLGASNIAVGGAFFDVMFLDGSTSSLFGSADPGTLNWYTASFADMASQALLDQVFLDSGATSTNPAWLFDTDPYLTNGCIADATCNVLTWTGEIVQSPFGTNDYLVRFAQNAVNESGDLVSPLDPFYIPPFFDSAQFADDLFTWALWSPSSIPPTPVPLPGALIFFASGIAGLGVIAVGRRDASVAGA